MRLPEPYAIAPEDLDALSHFIVAASEDRRFPRIHTSDTSARVSSTQATWQTGLAKLFAGQDCERILSYFGQCGLTKFCATDPRQLPTEFDAALLLDNCMTVIYLGVRADRAR